MIRREIKVKQGHDGHLLLHCLNKSLDPLFLSGLAGSFWFGFVETGGYIFSLTMKKMLLKFQKIVSKFKLSPQISHDTDPIQQTN